MIEHRVSRESGRIRQLAYFVMQGAWVVEQSWFQKFLYALKKFLLRFMTLNKCGVCGAVSQRSPSVMCQRRRIGLRCEYSRSKNVPCTVEEAPWIEIIISVIATVGVVWGFIIFIRYGLANFLR